MPRDTKLKYSLDKIAVIIYLILVIFGWLNIYAASYDFDQSSVFDFENRAGKQFVWALTAFALAGITLLLDARVFNYFAYVFYGFSIVLLIITLIVAPEIKGSRSWLVFGPVSFQPAELAKMTTALALARFMSAYNYTLKNWKDLIPLFILIMLPMSIIVLQKETGGALVFFAFLLMFYREGMNGMVLLLGVFAVILFIVAIRFGETVVLETNQITLGLLIVAGIILLIQFIFAFFVKRRRKETLILLAGVAGVVLVSYLLNIWIFVNYDYIAIGVIVSSAIYWVVIASLQRIKQFYFLAFISLGAIIFSFSADYLFDNMLESHQQIRIKVLLNMEQDLRGAGYNVNQSKIAIGSGGLIGKGYLNGTQTKLKYVPEQDTDFIFCTVGEEWGFVGSTILIILYLLLFLRILRIAERQREAFGRIYGYSVASIFFFHLMVNIGMVIGIMPVIGIPLPFLSYGGSSLWSFTILLFILLSIDASRRK